MKDNSSEALKLLKLFLLCLFLVLVVILLN